MKIRRNCLHNMLTKKGFFNTRFYVDDGISGTTFERDGFKTMLNDVQNGEVKTVIVKDMSRFGRDYIQVGMYTEILFPQNNVRFIAINDSYDSANGDNDFIPFKNIMNEWYAKDTSKKSRRSIGQRHGLANILLQMCLTVISRTLITPSNG